jgi:hypothetical protein
MVGVQDVRVIRTVPKRNSLELAAVHFYTKRPGKPVAWLQMGRLLLDYSDRDLLQGLFQHEVGHMVAGLDADHGQDWKDAAAECGAPEWALAPTVPGGFSSVWSDALKLREQAKLTDCLTAAEILKTVRADTRDERWGYIDVVS